MDVTLIRNGYNVERRKMYIENPRHNLRSSVDFVWRESLQENPSIMNKKKQMSAELVKSSYTQAIDRKLQQQLKLNKSSFRVMPIQNPKYNNNYSEALSKQIISHNQRKVSAFENSPQQTPVKKSQSLSKSVFGYDIDTQSFKRQSYLSKILGDKLGPHLKKQLIAPRHQSFTINQPVQLQY